MSVDRNAADSQRLRRNQQRGRAGGATSGVLVSAPLANTGTRIQLNLDSTGGLESSSSLLRVKLIDTSISRTASGIGVALKASGGLQIATGLGVLLNGTTLLLGASGLSINAGGVGSAQLGLLTTKGDLAGFSTVHARIPVGATNGMILVVDSTDANGVRWGTTVQGEVPTGLINGANKVYTLAHTPTPATIALYKNGVRMVPTTDYTLAVATITMVVSPATASTLISDYAF